MAVAALQAIGTKVITATLGFSYLTPTAALLAGTATVALGAAALRALTPKPSLPKVTGYNVTSRGSALDHQVVYGKTRVAGVEVFKATTGTDNAYLHLVLAFTGHEIESFEEIWINDEKATLDGNGNVTTVTTEDGDTSSRYSNKLTIIKRLGGTDNATPPDFGSSPNRPTDAGWTSVHKLTGISYLYCRLKFDRDAFPNGIPEIQATVKGKKVYNPDTATTEWSDNPALCIRDYLISSGYGLGEATSAIDDTLFVAAAEACDVTSDHSQTPTIWGSSYPIGTKKYTLNGAFTTGAKPADVLEDMLTSMGGTLWYAQGKWRVKAAKWYAPTVSLDEDDLRSGMTINTRHAARDNFNTIKGTFRGVESNYIETDYQQFPKDDSTNPFITVDNDQKSVIDIPLAFTDNSVTARRLARIALERHRQQLTFTATFGMKAFQLQVGDVVNITNTRMGWSSKAFEIVSWTFTTGQDLELLVEMSLRETAESAFDEVDDGVIYERDNTTLFSPFFVPSVALDSPFSSNAMNSDGTAVPFIDFSWTPTDPSRIDYYVFEWSTDAGVTYNPTTTSGTTFRLSPTETGKAYLYRVTPYNYLGVSGTTVTSAVGIAATADGTTPNAPDTDANGDALNTISASGGYRTTTVTWTEPTTNTDASALTDLKYYRVYRGTSSNPTTEAGVTFSNIFTDGGLADATQYYYRVKAVDRTGNESAYSTETNVTTNAELVDGINSASVFLYKANTSNTTPPNDPTGTFTYTFSTGVLSGGTLDDWSQTPPDLSEGEYLWAITATAASRTSTDSIPASEFSDAFVFTESANAYRSATVTLYKKNTSGTTAPTDPTGPFTYTFATAVLTTSGDFDGWSQSAPSLGKGEYLWVIQATAFNNGTTDTIAASEFSTAVVGGIGGADGADGSEYASLAYDDLYSPTISALGFGVSGMITGQGDYFLLNSDGTLSISDIGNVSTSGSTLTSLATKLIPTYGTVTHIGIKEPDEDSVNSSTANAKLATIKVGSVIKYTYGNSFITFEVTSIDFTYTFSGSQKLYCFGVTRTDGSMITPSASDDNDVVFEINYQIKGADGAIGTDGVRGAGRWYVGVTSLPTTSSGADAEFVSSLGFDPVDRDQAWFYTGTIGSPTAQSVWIYNETTDTWNEQEEVIDGDLIVTGTITANQIDTGTIQTGNIAGGAVESGNLAPDAVNSSLININSPLNFGEPTSAILGGRESLSDFSTAGFYIGRTSSDGTNADGFQLSHTSTNNNGDVQGVVHDYTGFNIFEPTFRLKSGTSTPNTALTTQGQTISLAYGQVHTISIIGGGGGGGGASNETSTKAGTYHGTAGSSGGNTTITLTGASGYTGTTSWTASGGSGGARGEDNTNHWNRGGGYTPDGPSGQTAGYGDGGAGGDGVLITLGTDRNGNNGSSPSSTSYGAGGGAGSPASNTEVNEIWWGNAGGSGGAGQVLTVEIDLTSATTDGTLTLTTLGSGGSGGAGFGPLGGTTSGSGGSGANGALVVVSELDGYTALSVNDVRFTFFEPDHSIAITSFTDNGTDHTVYGPFTEDRFVEMSGSYLGAYSWNTNDRWGLKVYATTSTVASRAYIVSISGSSSASSSTTDSTVTGSTNLSTGNAGTNGIFFGYATRDRLYSSLSFSVKLFLPAGATIRQVGEWNGVAPTSVGISGGAWIV